MARLSIIISAICLFIYNSISTNDLKESERLYKSVGQFYQAGEYSWCARIGDSLVVSDIYSALAMGISALSHHKLAFGEHSYTPNIYSRKTTSYLSNIPRRNFKASKALDYLSANLPPIDEIKSENLSKVLEFYDISARVSLISDKKLYYKISREIHENLFYKIHMLSVIDQITVLYNECRYQADRYNYSILINELVPRFEDLIWESCTNQESKHIAEILYNDLSSYINMIASQHERENPALVDLSCNLLIRSRDYHFYVSGAEFYKKSQKITWQEVQSNLPRNSYAVLFYELPDGNQESFNPGWVISNKSDRPTSIYGGHSYNAEKESLEILLRDIGGVNDYFYISGTSNMSLLDYTIDNRVIRLHSISNIINKRIQDTSLGNMLAIGNISYSNSKSSRHHLKDGLKGISDILQDFDTGPDEMEFLSSLFKDKVFTYQNLEAKNDILNKISGKTKMLHISTHGNFDEDKLFYELTGDVDIFHPRLVFQSCVLYLSGYNDDSSQYISAYDITKYDLSNLDLVFVSACQSGNGRNIGNGTYSLPIAFHIAGAKNVVAFIDPIKEDVAVEFTKLFYTKISQGISIHDAFYEAKMTFCPDTRVVLWE